MNVLLDSLNDTDPTFIEIYRRELAEGPHIYDESAATYRGDGGFALQEPVIRRSITVRWKRSYRLSCR